MNDGAKVRHLIEIDEQLESIFLKTNKNRPFHRPLKDPIRLDIHYYLIGKIFFCEKRVAVWSLFCNFAVQIHRTNITLYQKMADKKTIKTALISVFHKDGLEELLKKLNDEGVKFLSTGGTQTFIESLGYPCEKVENVTTYPSILGGRVKTLHPKVFGGILGRRELEGDREQMAKYEIPEIDLVIVDLYPFEQTVASGASEEDIIEKIDIGGISLIRAGAKNFNDVVIVPSKAEYGLLLDILNEQGAETTKAQRREVATRAFGVSSHYDTAIHAWFEKK